MASEARHLDRRVKVVWEFPTILAMSVFWLVASIAYFIFFPENALFGVPHVLFPLALAIALLILVGLPLNFWVGLIYQNFTYELTDSDIVIREGVITRKTTVIPYGRIQDIRTERTLIERFLGLATLEIETAGSSKVASETLIPGIANKNEVISEIMRMVEKAKSGDGLSGTGQQEKAPGLDAAMAEVLKELKTISSKLDTLGPQNGLRGHRREKPDVFEPLEHDDDLAKHGGARDSGRSPLEFKKFRKK